MPKSHAAPVDEAQTPESWDDLDALDETPPDEAGEPEGAADDPEDAAEGEALPTDDPEDVAPDPEDEPPPSAEPGDAGTSPDADAAPEDDAGARPEGQPTPSETETADAEPFRYKADGTDFEVPGATVEDGEIRLTRDAWQRHIQPQLADRRKIMQERRELVQRAEQAGKAHEAELETWQEIGEALEQLFSADDETLVQRIAQLKRQWPELKLQAERAALEDQKKRLTATQEERQREEQIAQLRPHLESHLDGAIKAVAEQAFADAGFDDGVFERVRDNLMEWWDRGLFFQATEADAAEHGVEPGTLMVKLDPIERELRSHAEMLRSVRERKAKEKKNRKALGKETKPTAPAVSAKGGTQPTRDEKEPESYDEWVASL